MGSGPERKSPARRPLYGSSATQRRGGLIRCFPARFGWQKHAQILMWRQTPSRWRSLPLPNTAEQREVAPWGRSSNPRQYALNTSETSGLGIQLCFSCLAWASNCCNASNCASPVCLEQYALTFSFFFMRVVHPTVYGRSAFVEDMPIFFVHKVNVRTSLSLSLKV